MGDWQSQNVLASWPFILMNCAWLGWAATFSDQEKIFHLRDKLWRKNSQIYSENDKKEGQPTTDLLESLNFLSFCLEIVKIRVLTVTPSLPPPSLPPWLQNGLIAKLLQLLEENS